uniref:Uncharacterized protein n=1 Tax=Toxoplasma gondii COUG TaxID=1074873 RepID=A0A2G8XR01_TOXGO|nr:hypothetical protein TGCOUG_319390 [Toxoplasma gondii COUG]
MPAKPPNATRTMPKGKGKKQKAQGQKNLPPRPDLRYYSGQQGPLPKPGWYIRCSLDAQIDASARKLQETSPVTRPNGLRPRILLEASKSRKLARFSSSPHSDEVHLERRASFSNSPVCLSVRPKTAFSFVERPDIRKPVTEVVAAARTPSAAMVVSRPVLSAGSKTETAGLHNQTCVGIKHPSQMQANAAQLKTAITLEDVRALNIAADPRFLEMQEFASRCAERMHRDVGGPGLEQTSDSSSAVPPPRRFRLEAKWIPKKAASEVQNAMSMVERPLWAHPLSSLPDGNSRVRVRRPSAFWNPKSYQHTDTASTAADSKSYTQAFYAELANRLREVVSCRDTNFRLAHLDNVYEWFQRERTRFVTTASNGAQKPGDYGGTGNPNCKGTDAPSANPADLPPAYAFPELPCPSDAFDASALASSRGSAFFDPQKPRRDSYGGFVDQDSVDSLDSSADFRHLPRQDRLLLRQRERKGSSASDSICSSRRSSALPHSNCCRRGSEGDVSVAENRDVENRGPKTSRHLTLGDGAHLDSSVPCGIRVEDPPFLEFVQSHAPLISPQDYLLELETRDLIPPGSPEKFVNAGRMALLSQIQSPVRVVTSRKASLSATGRGYEDACASSEPSDGLGALEAATLGTSSQTWASRCHRKYRGDLQQRYIQDLRKLRPPWGMKNIHANSPSKADEGNRSVSSSSAWRRSSNHFTKAGRPPRHTFAGYSSSGATKENKAAAELNLEERWLVCRHRDIIRMRHAREKKQTMEEWARRRSLLLTQAQKQVEEIRCWQPPSPESSSSSESSSDEEETLTVDPPLTPRSSAFRWSIDSRRASDFSNGPGWRVLRDAIAKRTSLALVSEEAHDQTQREREVDQQNAQENADDSGEDVKEGNIQDDRSSSLSSSDSDNQHSEDNEQETSPEEGARQKTGAPAPSVRRNGQAQREKRRQSKRKEMKDKEEDRQAQREKEKNAQEDCSNLSKGL